MPKPKPSKPILKLVPPSPWLQKAVNDIEYWVHKPSRKCGIHIRGLARLCGVAHPTILGILRNAKKAEVDLVGLRKSDIYNLLKNRNIFLKDLVGLSPMAFS